MKNQIGFINLSNVTTIKLSRKERFINKSRLVKIGCFTMMSKNEQDIVIYGISRSILSRLGL